MPKTFKRLFFVKKNLPLSIAFTTMFALFFAVNASGYDIFGDGGGAGCSGPDHGTYEPPPCEPPPCEPPPCEPPPCEPPPCEPPPCEPPPCEPPPCEPPPCEPPPCEPPPCEPPPCEPPPCEPPPCEPPPCEPPPCEPPPCEPPPCEPPKENPPCEQPPPEDDCANISIFPFIFGDYRQFRIITAEPVPPCVVKKDCSPCQNQQNQNQIQCEKQGRTESQNAITLKASTADGVYNVDDRRDGLIFAGVFVGVGLADAGGVGIGVGLAAILEGSFKSFFKVADLKKAQRSRALKRPKKAKDIEKWQIGDKLQYSFGLGGMAPIGAGAFGFGAGFAPMAGHRWRVTIEKIADHVVKLNFDDECNLACRVGVGSFLINKSLIKAKVKGHKNVYEVDISTDEGKETFKELMHYGHMFDGGIKDFDEIKKSDDDEYQFVHLTETGDIEIKSIDHKKLRVRLPLLFNYAVGKKVEKIHETNCANADSKEENNQIINCERKINYHQLSALNNFFKKKNRRSLHRFRELNGVAQGSIIFKDGHPTMFAEAKLTLVNNRLKDRHYKKAIKRINDYIDVNQPLTGSFVWPENIKHENSLIASVSISLNDDGIKNLLLHKEQISTYYPPLETTSEELVKEYLDMNEAIQKLYEKLYALNTELERQDKIDDNPEIASLLRKIIDGIRDSYYLIQAVETLIPGALSIKMELSGTLIQPEKFEFSVRDLL